MMVNPLYTQDKSHIQWDTGNFKKKQGPSFHGMTCNTLLNKKGKIQDEQDSGVILVMEMHLCV